MERRKTSRTAVRKLAYVNFEPYNTGGVITDISASGLRFHTIAPLQQGGVLRLSLVFAGLNHLEAVGEVVWTDSTHKIGGVRFVVLPPAAAEQIRNWLENSASANGSQTGAKAETVPVTEPGASISSAPSVLAERTLALAAASPPGPQLPNAQTGGTLARAWVLRAKPSTAVSVTQPQRRRSPFVRGLVGAVIVCLIVPPMVQLGLQHYNWLSTWIPHSNPVVSNPVPATPNPTLMSGVLPGLDVSNSGETNSAAANPAESTSLITTNPATLREEAQQAVPNPNSQPANPKTAAETESPQTSAAETSLAPKAEAAAPGRIETAQSPSEENPPLATAPRNSAVPASEHVAQVPASSARRPPDNPGETELILAWQYLEGQGRPRDPVAASHLLWTAVEKGNPTAETTLANLYLRGEGVSKSCDQARVLLSAASDKGSSEAKRKLRDLSQTGCR
jgi:hypothetical protein